jgi:DnaJ-class molecular chaperone
MTAKTTITYLAVVCQVCNGKGWLSDPRRNVYRRCIACQGRGHITLRPTRLPQ